MTNIGYKLTNEKMQTYCGYQWELQQWKETNGEGELCSPGWLHYYSDPLLAAFLNPIHADFAAPRLFQVEVAEDAKVLEDHGLKLGCTKMRLVKELEMPAVTMEQRVKFGILCALEVYDGAKFVQWAANWLDGTDRSEKAAWAANAAAAWAVDAAAAAWAANAAARAAEVKDIDLIAIAKKAME
jgi:Cu/Ag efflux protein CusF